jgi:hypothetical protein
MRRKLWEVNVISSVENCITGKGEVKYSFVFLVPEICLALSIKKKTNAMRLLFPICVSSCPLYQYTSSPLIFSVTSKPEIRNWLYADTGLCNALAWVWNHVTHDVANYIASSFSYYFLKSWKPVPCPPPHQHLSPSLCYRLVIGEVPSSLGTLWSARYNLVQCLLLEGSCLEVNF